MNQTFFFAKIGKGNELADKYLEGKSEVDFPAIPIYFERDSANEDDFLNKGNAKEQGRLFFSCGKECEGKFIVVIHDGKVVLLRPTGPVLFKPSTVHDEVGNVKLLPVEHVKSARIAYVPPILAGIGSNRYYSSGTFRKITNPGNVIALKTLLLNPDDIRPPPDPKITSALECLGSVEFETLIAKIFEEAGCFVPAYRGGVIQDVDLFARNTTDKPIAIGRVSLAPSERIAIQVSLKSKKKPAGANYLIAPNAKEADDYLGAEWLISVLKPGSRAREWLFASLDWLPRQYLDALRRAF